MTSGAPARLAALATAAVLAACGGGSTLAPGGHAYVVDLDAEDARDLPGIEGRWELALSGGSRFTVRQDGRLVVEGRYRVDGYTLALRDEGGPTVCDPPVAVYAWTLSDGELDLTPIDDDCRGRRLVLTTRPLRRR